MAAARSPLHSTWIALLALLLALAPFIHGHLGQPLQRGWHVHPQAGAVVQTVAAAAVPASATPAAQYALQQPEPTDVEVAAGIMPARLPQIAAVAPSAASGPSAHPAPAAPRSATPVVVALVLPAAAEPAPARSDPGLPPPALAPPRSARA